MTSIRNRLLVSLLISVSCISVIGFTAIYYLAEHALHHQFDTELRHEIDSLALMGEVEDLSDLDPDDLEYEDGGDDPENLLRFEFADLNIPRYQPQPESAAYQVWDESGQVLARSPSLQGRDLTFSAHSGSAPVIVVMNFADGRKGKMVSRTFSPEIPPELKGKPDTVHTLRIAVARSTHELDLATTLFFKILTMSGAATVIAVGFAIGFAVRRGLAPLRSLQRDINQIDLENFSFRIQTESLSRELIPIAQCLNDLAARIESTLKRERRFSSDIAHELRTPVSELQALTEVSMKRANVGPAEMQSFADANSIAIHMERIIRSLLDLSRCEAGLIPIENDTVDVEQLANSTWATFQSAAQAKQITFNANIEKDVHCTTDPALFTSILANLFSNAVEYTPEGGSINFHVYSEQGRAVIEMTNTVGNMDVEDLDSLFDTFWRKDTARTDSGHLGIGLALVAAVSKVLGIAIKTALIDTSHFQISLQVPARTS